MSDELGCPRCGARMFRASATSVTMCACGACGGAFLDNTATSRLMSLVPDDALALAEGVDAHARHAVERAAAVACPVCRRPMTRVHVKAAGVDVDTCSAHGTFYDREELVTVARACKRARVARPLAGGAAVVGAATVAAVAIAHGQQPAARNVDTDAVEVAADVAEVAVDVASDGVLELAGELIGGLFELIGALSD